LEEKEVLRLILKGAVEGYNCQPRRLRERRKIGICPIPWGRTRRPGQRTKRRLKTAWFVEEVDPLIFEPAIVGLPRIRLTLGLVGTHHRRLA